MKGSGYTRHELKGSLENGCILDHCVVSGDFILEGNGSLRDRANDSDKISRHVLTEYAHFSKTLYAINGLVLAVNPDHMLHW